MDNTITTTYADGRVETRPMTEEEIAVLRNELIEL